MKNKKVLIELKEVGFSKNKTVAFKNISWEIKEDENWAIIGPNGAGKTLLAEAIAGRFFIPEGKIVYNIPAERKEDFIGFISFSENSGIFNYSNHYYQQRFNAFESDGGLTAQEFLGDVSQAKEWIDVFEIGNLLEREFIKLSNGQTRKVRLVKALAKKPQVLILDSPFVGLDQESKNNLKKIINELPSKGTNIILISPISDIPACMTHVLELENQKIKRKARKEDFLIEAGEKEKNDFQAVSDFFNSFKKNDLKFKVTAEFNNVNIKYGEKQVLKNINWTINQGEKWALLGPNGAGKSTLLSLINADNPQAYSQNIILFDKPRGTGESIWDIKKQIGYISPELHLYFRFDMESLEVAATGFVDTLFLNRSLTETEKEVLNKLFDFLQIGNLKERTFLSLSIGEQRIVLFIRSLVKNPPVLILDEPFQGMTEETVIQCKRLLQLISNPQQTIIFVTHEKSEIPDFINKTFRLEDGIGKILD